jgi:hypothetical protein
MVRSNRSGWLMVLLGAAFVALLAVHPATAQLQITSPDGNSSFKIGVLGQVQGESIENADAADDTSNNIYLRRIRLLANFQWGDDLTMFVDTDAPNLGKGNTDGSKNNIDMFIQDAFASYKFSKGFILDAGMMLPPDSYNHTQSAAALLAIDYGSYTFNESTPLTARTGRDYGVQARGYLADDHIEYRAGVFQGARGENSVNPFRVAGRLVFWAWGAQTGYFYRGSSLGKDSSLGIGGSFDQQKDYKAYSGDVYWEQALAGGDGITVQVDYQTLDGSDFLVSLPKQTNSLAEIGYYIHSAKLQPYIQYAKNDFDAADRADEERKQVGLAYYFKGNNSNFKIAWTKIDKDGLKDRNQYLLQYQVYQF